MYDKKFGKKHYTPSQTYYLFTNFTIKKTRFYLITFLDSSIDSEEDPTHSWNFLEDENYIKLSSCYFESYDIFEKGKIDEEFELLQGLAKKSGHKIIISTVFIHDYDLI